VLFIHGWKNNAGEKTNNVLGFRSYLQQARAKFGDSGLVGVFWMARWPHQSSLCEGVTYWNRRDTATYLPGSNMSEAQLRVAIATKDIDYGKKENTPGCRRPLIRRPRPGMQMPVEIAPDHTTIFRAQFGELLQAFILRGSAMGKNPMKKPATATLWR
jgi:hypothetical protein